MSIATEITRLQNAKTAIKTAIEGKGVTVPDATLLDGMASLIESIEAGGGGDTSVEDGLVTREITSYTNSRVLKIGSNAFWGCSALTSVDLPAATSISNNAFWGCSALTSVDLPAATSISNNAFWGCSALTSVDLPAATSISNNAFWGCSALTSVDLPAATSISNNAFYQCSALTSVDLPAATSISGSTFRSCSKLTTVNLPAATSISDGAFYQCSALTSVALRNTEKVCTLSNTSAFTYTPIASGTGYIYVPDALVDQYKAATNWSAYAAQIKPLSEYTEG